jgi:muramoyltetrapeptide carboxypeptidase
MSHVARRTLPAPLAPGDRILVVAPSSAPRSEAGLTAGLAALRARGYRAEPLRDAYHPHGYRALRDPDAKAIFCVRGGYGALRLLPGLDFDAARRHPKLLVGYSDVTALHLALYSKAGWRGLSGPMVAVEWAEGQASCHDDASEALFWHLARGGTVDDLAGPQDERLEPVRTGTAEGVLLGGNLTLVARLVGTPYLPDLTGAILFLEEIGEEPYRLDSLFAQLALAGVLERLGGLVLGGFTEGTPTQTHFLPQEDVLAHYAALVPGPVAQGLAYGHFASKNTVPVGVRARLTVEAGRARLAILEPVTKGPR